MDDPHNIYIAVIDDDCSFCRSLSRWLRATHFQPVVYSSAEAFLEDGKRPTFDCLLLDIQLGGMSGLELCQRLAAVRDTTPIIFITAHDDPGVRAQAASCRCAGYFRKTSSGAEILAAIRRATGLADATGEVRSS